MHLSKQFAVYLISRVRAWRDKGQRNKSLSGPHDTSQCDRAGAPAQDWGEGLF